MRGLRAQLIGVLVLALLLPLLPATFAARELFRRSLDPLLADGFRGSAEAGLAVTRDAMDAGKAEWRRALEAGAPFDTLSTVEVSALRLEPAARDTSAPGARLLQAPALFMNDTSACWVARVRRDDGRAAWAVRAVPETLAARAQSIDRGVKLLGTLRRERDTLLRGFLATFLAVYLALVLVVLVVGLWLVSRLTRPLSELAQGIDRVAGGDLGARVSERGSAEIAGLMRRFNAMSGRLEAQHAELARLERLAAWRRMARFLAHEIKNPLTPIQLAAEQMRDAYRGDDPAYGRLLREGTSIIEEEVAGLRNWVAQFSQFARMPDVSPAPLAPADLAADLQAAYGTDALAVEAGPHADTAWVRADRDALKRALVNLIDNALAAQRDAGVHTPVELAVTRETDGGSRWRVRDHGPGVPADVGDRVFEPDYTTKPDGMGLGLAIVENIVRQHAGTIALQHPEGGGAAFEIALPPDHPAGGRTA